jgi:hypothetical protein
MQPVSTKERLPDDEGYYFALDSRGRKITAFFPFGFDGVKTWFEEIPTNIL